MNQTLLQLIADLKEEEALALVETLIKEKVDPLKLLDTARGGMEVVGERFEKGDYFIPDLIMAGEILKGISERVKPLLNSEQTAAKKGRVLIGTVAGDIHDIGKDIVTFMLEVSGYDVMDLGIDVPVPRFIEAIREFQPGVVGLSGFLTLAYDSMKKTVEAIEESGFRESLKIMIGGGQMDEEVRKYVRADAYGKDAVAAVNLCRQWSGVTV